MRNQNPIGKPIRSIQTMLRALASANDALETVIPDGIYGEETKCAVLSFQREYGLPRTGIVDIETWEYIVREHDCHRIVNGPSTPLYFYLQPGQIIIQGETNTHMYMINGVLQGLSAHYASMPVAESGGVHTSSGAEAVRWLQNRANIERTGDIDRHTWRMIAGLYRATVGDGTENRG